MKYKLKDLIKVDVCLEFVSGLLSEDWLYLTVNYDGEWYTTWNNYDFIMELYQYYDPNKRLFTVGVEGELDKDHEDFDLIKKEVEIRIEEIFIEVEQKHSIDNLNGYVIDPNNPDYYL
jgi:hypothetical protein